MSATPEVVADVWSRLGIDRDDPDVPEDKSAEPKHLLWALLFLKTNLDDHNLSSKCEAVSEPTYRKWKWIFIGKISYLETEIVSS